VQGNRGNRFTPGGNRVRYLLPSEIALIKIAVSKIAANKIAVSKIAMISGIGAGGMKDLPIVSCSNWIVRQVTNRCDAGLTTTACIRKAVH